MKDEASMNVNGDLAAFLPEGSEVAANIAEVERDWTTNVMIICFRQGQYYRTRYFDTDGFSRIGNEFVPSDDGVEDDIKYILSISSVVKEINSSAPCADALCARWSSMSGWCMRLACRKHQRFNLG